MDMQLNITDDEIEAVETMSKAIAAVLRATGGSVPPHCQAYALCSVLSAIVHDQPRPMAAFSECVYLISQPIHVCLRDKSTQSPLETEKTAETHESAP